VPILGGESVKLNDPLVEGGQTNGGDFAFSPDSSVVVYLADQDSVGVDELYFAPITGGGSTKLNDPLVAGGNVDNFGLPNSFGSTSFGFQISPDSSRVVYLADQDIDDQVGLYTTLLGETASFQVSSVEPNSSGFTVEFNGAFDPSVLNLYDTQTAGLGPADVTLQGAAGGPIAGSFVVDPSLSSGTFIKSGGPLAADTYTVRLRSGADGFMSTAAGLLDGNGDGTAGDDFEDTFTIVIADAPPAVISLPDFVRGPGQDVNLPADTTAGIPVSISDGTGVRNVTIQIGHDPALLDITAATVGLAMPAEATVVLDTSTAGTAILTLTSPTDLPAGENVLVNLQANVPTADASANYRRQQVLDVHGVALSDAAAAPIAALADDALHLVTFFGDVSANGRINAADAAQVARIAALLDFGFAATLLTDPGIPGDISGNSRLNAADASLAAQFAALIPVPQIPPLPGGVVITGLGVPFAIDDRLNPPSAADKAPPASSSLLQDAAATWALPAVDRAIIELSQPTLEEDLYLSLEAAVEELLR
jgi:hypothetical protein